MGGRGKNGRETTDTLLISVQGFTEALSQELKPEWGIQLTCIEPGKSFRLRRDGMLRLMVRFFCRRFPVRQGYMK